MSAEPNHNTSARPPGPVRDSRNPLDSLDPEKREFEGHSPRWGAGQAPLAKRLTYMLRRFLRRRR